ncbi:threonine--tRNA ligase [Planosporangium sp. 12N6]|uniref:threonine--tRNA ligase n=1 Tax=Planosporangium spinosum TaxID=3402278 RepID=UPI003CE83AD9
MNDHRRLGRDLELFHSAPLVGAGLPIWLPDGAAARYAVESYLREEERRAGYRHVYSPPLARREMYERSGHLANFADDMFAGIPDGTDELYLRPSLCPHHAMVFAARGRSYRDLPLRVAEIGPMYRAERSGVLSGLSRVRAISLNDAHLFCAPEQVVDEVAAVLAMVRRAYGALGIPSARYRLSLAGGGKGKYVDDPAGWARAEAMLREALRRAGVRYEDAPGEAAFYGPKIDVQVAGAGGREVTLSTVQVDFHQPARFDLSYVDAGGARVRPVLVHRSVVGSLERLFAHLVEVHGGAFPVWYAPVHLVAVPVGEAQCAAAEELVDRCVAAGLRAEVDRDGTVAARVRAASVRRKVPYVAVLGAREAAEGSVSMRLRDGTRRDRLPVDEALALVTRVVAVRSPTALLP